MKKAFFILYILSVCFLAVISYGFLDLHLTLSQSPAIVEILEAFRTFASANRQYMTLLWLVGLCGISICYVFILKHAESIKRQSFKYIIGFLVSIAIVFSLAYPAHSYDLFNYITTAKVTFFHHENPYIVMPIEILHEPYIAFTRAANKVALYGPVWIILSAIPHYLGLGNIWLTIILFKGTNAALYLLFSFFIFKATKSIKNVLFFACNPLVIMEVILSGHNDIYMMMFAIFGLYLWYHGRRVLGMTLLFASFLIKGVTIVLLPVLFKKYISWEKLLRISYFILLAVFFIIAPIREELYPWYAVWFISIASFLPLDKDTFIYWFTIVLSFALELRHLPYMWMGYYEGPGPTLRMLLTAVPICIFLLFYLFNNRRKTIS